MKKISFLYAIFLIAVITFSFSLRGESYSAYSKTLCIYSSAPLSLTTVVEHFKHFLLLFSGNEEASNKAGVQDERLGKEVLIKEGDYWVGSDTIKDEQPLRTMHIESYYIDIHPVTNLQYIEFLRKSSYEPAGAYDENYASTQLIHPATNITHKDAEEYCKFYGKRLPTEWEWEIAARSLKKENAYVWGKNINPEKCNWLNDINNPKMSTPVFQYEPNELGLYDMAGNVFEWTSSLYPKEFLRGKNASRHTIIVLKGGAWTNIIYDITVSARVPFSSERYLEWIGFRCVKSYNNKD